MHQGCIDGTADAHHGWCTGLAEVLQWFVSGPCDQIFLRGSMEVQMRSLRYPAEYHQRYWLVAVHDLSISGPSGIRRRSFGVSSEFHPSSMSDVHATWYMLPATCYMQQAACYMPQATCCMLHTTCHMLHVA